MTIAIAMPRSSDPLAGWRREILCRAVAHARGGGATVNAVMEEYFGKSVVTPTSTSATALGPTATGSFLKSLRPKSASARLFDRSIAVDLDGVNTVSLPRMSALTAPTWILEGDPIPVVQGTTVAATLGPKRKLAAVTSLTGELARMGVGQAQMAIQTSIEEAAAIALDASVFSTTPASSSRPAGILFGVTPLLPLAGGGQAAMINDLKQLAAAIATAGGGSSLMLFANPAQAIVLAATVGPAFDEIEDVSTPALPAGTVVLIETAAVVYSADDPPKVDFSNASAIHMETVPLQIATGVQGSGVLATPTQSLWQTDTVAMRLLLRATWAVRAPGFVQFINNATW